MVDIAATPHACTPGYALLPRGGLCDTTVYDRNLGR
jgi:hypothetical protein